MKVTVENKKGLNKDIKVFIDKKTMNSYMDEKYEEIKKLLTAGWVANDTVDYSSIYVFNASQTELDEVYTDLKNNWNKYTSYDLKKSLNKINKTNSDKYNIRKQNPNFLFEQSRKHVLYRMSKGYTPKKSTLIKYNLS